MVKHESALVFTCHLPGRVHTLEVKNKILLTLPFILPSSRQQSFQYLSLLIRPHSSAHFSFLTVLTSFKKLNFSCISLLNCELLNCRRLLIFLALYYFLTVCRLFSQAFSNSSFHWGGCSQHLFMLLWVMHLPRLNLPTSSPELSYLNDLTFVLFPVSTFLYKYRAWKRIAAVAIEHLPSTS